MGSFFCVVERYGSIGGKAAMAAGATRGGAGRGIAIELGAAGATVYVTGRTTSAMLRVQSS